MAIKYFYLVFLITFLSYSGNAKYIGCYRDISVEKRLMEDAFKEFAGTLTKKVCIDFCREQDAGYAGLQYGRECYCSKLRPSYKHLINNTECSMECEGDHSEICGERLVLSVHELDGRGVMKHEGSYVGCFQDYFEDRMLPDKMWEFPMILTPDFCMGQCWRNGYRYAGVQYGTECHCGDNYKEELRVDEEDCSTPCAGDRRIKCGSGLRSSIYATGITDLSPDKRLVGCFEDSQETRLLSDLVLNLFDNNSPKRCINICNSAGFKYSGILFRVECRCGNVRPPSALSMEINECSIPCPQDDTAQCGGNYRLLVHKTGVQATTSAPQAQKPLQKPSSILSTLSMGSKATSKPASVACQKSITTVNGRSVCRKSVVFFEEFNKPLDRTRWIHSVMMPWLPDYDFVVFTKKPENAFVQNGKLYIKPNLMEESFVRRGKLTLKECTGEPFTEECERKAVSYSILPPIESAKITTGESFSFKYGRVDIRAKLPLGDWLYPELLLEPKRKIYGRNYLSGRIRIAGARGNVELRRKGKDIGANQLESGVLLGPINDVKARSVVRHSHQPWGLQYHNYTVIWSPENIWFMVNGEVKQSLIPENGGKLYEIMEFKNNTSDTWLQSEVQVAPFDQECFLSVALSVGGIRNFPDNSTSGDYDKPWTNNGRKAMANFFQAKDNWIKTWSEGASILRIESIKVTSL